LNYENEREVGEGVRASPVDRADVSVTTKLPGRHHGFDATLRSFEESLPGLGLDYVDLYLIHWPLPAVDKYVDSWRAMIRLREEGVVREGLVTSIAETHGVTPSQVVLRWHLQLGAVPIPKSADELRQRENLDVFRFELSDAEVEAISTLESGRLWDADPETPEEF
ncbi:MAG: aldo/keto reductase, partial [Microbacteriaceae bacterium]|nr:aldo/keto reductase [Microbacteriaceae bacterium]